MSRYILVILSAAVVVISVDNDDKIDRFCFGVVVANVARALLLLLFIPDVKIV